MTLTIRDRVHALLLSVAAAALYLVTHQNRLWNDGIFFERKLRIGGEELLYNHILFLPLTRLFQTMVGWVEPITNETAMRSVAAIAGGIGVGIVFATMRAARQSPAFATAGAVLFAGLTSIWFHSTATELHSVQAASAAIYLLGLTLTLRNPTERPGRGTTVLLTLGACLAPAAHVSGMCIGLPAVVVWWLAPTARRRLFVCTALGVGLFVAAYLWVMSQSAGFAGYTDAHTGKYSVLWTNPERLPTLLTIALSEGALYAMPAASLVAGGLRVLFRTNARMGWLSLSWLLAWPLVAWPVGDRMFGAYYTPTAAVQVWLAILAARALARSPARIAGLCVLAASPVAAVVTGVLLGWNAERVGLAALFLANVAAWFWARDGAPLEEKQPTRPGLVASWGLAAIALAVSESHLNDVRSLDRVRTRIRTVQNAIRESSAENARPLLVYLAESAGIDEHWKLFFPGADGNEKRAFNPVRLGYVLDPTEAETVRKTFAATVRTALDQRRPVFLAGSIPRAIQAAPRKTQIHAFFQELTTFATLAPTPTQELHRIVAQ